MAANPPVASFPTKTCGVCAHVDPIPPGIDPTNVRCVNVDAMWHATYHEILIRVSASKMAIETHISACQRDVVGLEATIEAVKADATRIAGIIGD